MRMWLGNDIDDGRSNKLRIMRGSSPHLANTFNQCKLSAKNQRKKIYGMRKKKRREK